MKRKKNRKRIKTPTRKSRDILAATIGAPLSNVAGLAAPHVIGERKQGIRVKWEI
jgi:hypothetical protein